MATEIFLSIMNQRDKAKGCSKSAAGKGMTTRQVGCQKLFLGKIFSFEPSLGFLGSASAPVDAWVWSWDRDKAENCF